MGARSLLLALAGVAAAAAGGYYYFVHRAPAPAPEIDAAAREAEAAAAVRSSATVEDAMAVEQGEEFGPEDIPADEAIPEEGEALSEEGEDLLEAPEEEFVDVFDTGEDATMTDAEPVADDVGSGHSYDAPATDEAEPEPEQATPEN